MMKVDLSHKVFSFTSESALFSAPCHVLVGLSGGADSMALLHALLHWPKIGLRVSAIHIHHGLRGKAADRDEAFVRDYCERWGVPLTVVHFDVAAVAREHHLSIEEAGRRVRYEAFESARQSMDADWVLTAHTASDQAETTLLHLIRGCGVDGLTGIPAARGHIRRPLLCCTRAEVEEYCAIRDIPYVTDQTNADTVYTRNDIRHRVLPLLRQINPSVDEALIRLSRHAAEDANYLNTQAAQALLLAQNRFGYTAEKLAALPVAVRRRAIRQMFQAVCLVSFEEKHILAADEAVVHNGGAVSLADGYVFSVEQGVATVRKASCTALPPLPVAVAKVPCTVSFGEFSCELFDCDPNNENVHKLFLQYAVDYDKIMGKLCLRCRQTGDYLHPVGRGVGKSLKKSMNEWRIPAHLRDLYPLLCDDSGVILIPGYACDERVKVTANTQRVLVCRIGEG